MYGKQFITDVASDALSRNVRQINPALNYGIVTNPNSFTPNPHHITFTPTQSSKGAYT